jgi:hypothetical protein
MSVQLPGNAPPVEAGDSLGDPSLLDVRSVRHRRSSFRQAGI